MKLSIFLLAIVILLGCSRHGEVITTQPNAKLDEPFQLKVGQTASFADGFTVTFVSVPNDSRCPIGVSCVWAGNATVILKSGDGIDTLNTISPSPILRGQYTIKMDSLTPYPVYRNTIPPSAYVVALVVSSR